MSTPRIFLEGIQSKIEGLGPFLRVWITPELDLDAVLQVPRFPMVILNDTGGSLNPHNQVLWNRTFSATIVDIKPRDHVGEAATLEILDLGDDLIDGLAYGTDYEIWYGNDSDAASSRTNAGIMVVWKTYNFRYEIERD